MVPARTPLHACLAAALLPACFYDQGKSDPPSSGETTTSSSGSSSAAPATSTSLTPISTTTDSTTDASTSSSTSSSSSTSLDPTTGACVEQIWYADADDDGYGQDDATILACTQPRGYVALPGDCAPMAADVSPGQPELCDGKDNDCDLLVDEYAPTNATCHGCRTVLWPAESRVFYLCSVLVDWNAARAACQSYGLGHDLAVLHSAAEQNTIVAAINTVPADMVSPWWLGLTDAVVEGDFGWVDGSPLDFSAWLMGEPNDFNGEDCTQFPPGMPGAWNDAKCGNPNYYVCEGPQ